MRLGGMGAAASAPAGRAHPHSLRPGKKGTAVVHKVPAGTPAAAAAQAVGTNHLAAFKEWLKALPPVVWVALGLGTIVIVLYATSGRGGRRRRAFPFGVLA